MLWRRRFGRLGACPYCGIPGGSDVANGRGGNDIFFLTSDESGSAAINGGDGTDTAVFSGKIGQLAMENDFLAGALGRIGDASAKR
mgnify:CR=1 FL=1